MFETINQSCWWNHWPLSRCVRKHYTGAWRKVLRSADFYDCNNGDFSKSKKKMSERRFSAIKGSQDSSSRKKTQLSPGRLKLSCDLVQVYKLCTCDKGLTGNNAKDIKMMLIRNTLHVA